MQDMENIDARARALAAHLTIDASDIEALHGEFYVNRRRTRFGGGPSEVQNNVALVRKALRIIRGEETDKWTSDFFAGEFLRHRTLVAMLERNEREIKERERHLDLERFTPTRNSETWAQAKALWLEHGRLMQEQRQHEERSYGRRSTEPFPPEKAAQLEKFKGLPKASRWPGFDDMMPKEQMPYFQLVRRANDPTLKRLHAERRVLSKEATALATYRNLDRELRANPETNAMTRIGLHDLVNTLYWLVPDSERPDDYEAQRQWRAAVRAAFDGKPLEEWRKEEWTQDSIWLVLTEAEANARWEESLDNYIDELILPEMQETARKYFDREKWKADARADKGVGRDGKPWSSRSMNLAGYDHLEVEVQDPHTRLKFLAYRTN